MTTKNNKKIQEILRKKGGSSSTPHPASEENESQSPAQEFQADTTLEAEELPGVMASAEATATATKIKELEDLVLREKAEVANLHRRHARVLEDTEKYAVAKFARDLVEVLENLYRARNHMKPTDENQTIIEGFDMNIKLFEDTLAKYQVARIDPLNQPFDPGYHQAIAQLVRADVPENTVVDVIQSGYRIADRLLRPALVAVSKAAAAATEAPAPEASTA